MKNSMFDFPENVDCVYSEPTTPENYIAEYVISDYEIYREHPQEIWNQVKNKLRWIMFEKLGDVLFGGTPICIMAKYVSWDNFDSFEKVVQLRVQVQKVRTMDFIMPRWELVNVYQGHKVEVKELCAACGSEWHEGKYHPGTCNNCGAPASWSFK